ncbi:MCE family protein [Herbaspirillum sp. HC18]|nr:MCE family protein [Herbaspirillum sp. HC18]
MENRAYALSAGLFLILLCIGLVLAAMRLAGSTADYVHYVIDSRFPVSGLQQSAPVRMRGVDVGKVGAIRFSRDDPHLILIEIAVTPDTPINRDTYAKLGFLGITGLSYIQLDDDGSQSEKLASSAGAAAHIGMRPSLLDQAGENGQQLLQDAAQAARRINALLSDENVSELSATISNAKAASANIARLAGDLQPTVKALTALTARADKTLQLIDPLLGNLTSLTEEVRVRAGVLDHIGQSAQDMGHTSQAIETALPRLNIVLDEVTHSMRTMNRVLDGIEQRPQSVLFGPAPALPGPGEAGFIPPRSP